MRYIAFDECDSYDTAILIKNSSINKEAIEKHYIQPLEAAGIARSSIIVFSLDYNPVGKAPVTLIKAYLDTLMPVLDELKVKNLYVADGNYFKVLAKVTKSEPNQGYVLPCKYTTYGHMNVVLGTNYQALIYNPDMADKLTLGINTLASHVGGTYQELGQGIIHYEHYPETLQEIQQALDSLHQYPELTCDVEAFSLKPHTAGIGTITFCWSKHEGIAFACDYKPLSAPVDGLHGTRVDNPKVRRAIKQFLAEYRGKVVYQNATFDTRTILYALWMRHSSDTVGLLAGLDILYRNTDDTKVIAYLATNSTAGNHLSLKHLAHEFAGNWAQSDEDIKDIRRIPLPDLLRYNLIDGLSTHYVKEKYFPIMVQDNQEELYHSLMMPSQKLITQMELEGMPINMPAVLEAEKQLKAITHKAMDLLLNNSTIKTFNLLLQTRMMEEANSKLVKKVHPLSHFSDAVLNPNSRPQMRALLYETLQLPVIDYTKTKLPATGVKTLKKLINHTTNPDVKEILETIIDFGQADKILSTFIPAFKGAVKHQDGNYYLHGNFNLNGTVSGRLSSSDPNMQNIPAGSKYAQLIKECFIAGLGWVFAGADFSSLEDYISALTTQDPNKLIIYEQGLDSHAFRAKSYWPDQIPDIELAEGNERCFRIQVNGQDLYCKSGDFILDSSGNKTPVEDFYASNKRL